jgi:hypothetical protein
MTSFRLLRTMHAGLGALALVLTVSPAAALAASPAAQVGPLCSHPFFPVSETAEWHYRAGMPSLPILMGEDVVRATNLTEGGFEMVRRVSDAGTLVRRWTCAADGLSDLERPATVVADDAPQAEGTVQYEAATGTTLPRPELWAAGYSWVQTSSGSFAGPDVIPGANPRAESSVPRTHTIVGQEAVSVPAGGFSAWRVQTTATGPVTVEIGGQQQTFEVTNSQTAWYVENVGLVKSTFSTDEMVVDTMELLSYQP